MIRKGQISIDGRKLDTFYGREYHGGVLVAKHKAFQLEKPVVLPQDAYDLVADQWYRSAYSSLYTVPHARSLIKGKVVGYVREEKPALPPFDPSSTIKRRR